VEQAVNAALNKSFQDAEALLLASFHDVTLEMLHVDVAGRMATRAGVPDTPCADSEGANTSPCGPIAVPHPH
jgi:hypothetical protein